MEKTQIDQFNWLITIVGRPPVIALMDESDVAGFPDEGKPSLLEVETEWRELENRKEERLAAVREKLEQCRDQIRLLTEFKVTLTKDDPVTGKKKGDTVPAFSPEMLWDPQNEFDPVHFMSKITEESLPPEQIELLKRASDMVFDMRDTLLGQIDKRHWQQIAEDVSTKSKTVPQLAKEWTVSEATIDEVVKRWASLQAGPHGSDDLKPIKDQQVFQGEKGDLEIRREFFDPLVRSKILPESEIEDRFSSTEQQFKGAKEGYVARLEKHSATLDKNQELLDKLKLAGIVVKSLGTAAGDLAGAIGATAKSGSELAESTEKASQIITLIQDVGMLAVTSVQGAYQKKAEGIVDAVGSVLADSLTLRFGKEVAEAVKLGYTAGADAGKIGLAFVGEGTTEDKIEAAIQQVGTAISSGMNVAGDPTLEAIGKSLKFGFVQAVNAKKVYACLNKDPKDIGMATKLISAAATQACEIVLSSVPQLAEKSEGVQKARQKAAKEGKSEEEQDKAAEEAASSYREAMASVAEKAEGAVDTASENLGASHEKLSEFAEQLEDPEEKRKLVAKLEAAANQRFTEDIQGAIEGQSAKFMGELRLGLVDTDPSIEKLQKEYDRIEPLIAEIQRTRAYLQMVEAIFDAGVGTAAQFVSALKIASAGKELLKNAFLAYECRQQFQEWFAVRADALAAASMQGFAFANRAENADFQMKESTAKAILAAAQVVGASLSVAGVTAVAGEVVTKAASATDALLTLALELYKEKQLADAWQAYTNALQHPGDRILMREAILQNTTLAKYAMAYAAVKERDPIALEGMSHAGLNEEVMRNPNLKVDIVVTFLETKWSQDPLNLRRVPISDWQADKSGKLSFKTWMANKNAALDETKMQENQLDAKRADTGGIEGALQVWDQTLEKRTIQESAVKMAKQEFEKIALPLEEAIRNYTTAVDLAEVSPKGGNELKELAEAHTSLTKELEKQLPKQKPEEDSLDKEAKIKSLKHFLLETEKNKPVDRLNEVLHNAQKVLLAIDECEKNAPNLDSVATEYVQCLNDLPETLSRQNEVALKLAALLRGFRPLNKQGKVSDTIDSYVKGLADKATEEAEAAAQQKSKIVTQGDAAKQRMATAKLELATLPERKKEFSAWKQGAEDLLKQISAAVEARARELSALA